jgi:hypothetical protein
MNALVNLVVERTGLGEDKAQMAVDAIVDFLKQRAPAGLAGQIDALVAGEGSSASGIAASTRSGIDGLFGRKE